MKKYIAWLLASTLILGIVFTQNSGSSNFEVFLWGDSDNSNIVDAELLQYEVDIPLTLQEAATKKDIKFMNVSFSGTFVKSSLYTKDGYQIDRYEKDDMCADIRHDTGEVLFLVLNPKPTSNHMTITEGQQIADSIVKKLGCNLNDFILLAENISEYGWYRYDYTGTVNGIQTTENIIITLTNDGQLLTYSQRHLGISEIIEEKITSDMTEEMRKEINSVRKTYSLGSEKLTVLPNGEIGMLYSLKFGDAETLEKYLVIKK